MLRYTSWKLTWNDQKRSWKLILGLNIYVFLGNLCSKLRHWHRYIMIRMISSFPFKVFLWWIPMPWSIIPLNLLEHFPQNGSKRDFIDLQQGKRIVFQWNTLNGNGFSLSHSGKLLRFSTELPFVFYVQGRMAGLDSNDTQLELWMPSIQCFSFVPLIFNWYLVKKHSDIGAHKFLIQDERSQPAEKIRHPSSFQPQNWALGDELLPLERWLVWCPLNSLGIHQECALAPMSGPELIGMKLARVPG